jgi:uncharacterized membrane protein
MEVVLMDGIMSMLHEFLLEALTLLAIVLELMGVFIIFRAALAAFSRYLSSHNEGISLSLASGLALGLTFFLGAEILLTATARTIQELAMICGVFLLRAVMSVLIHWETGHQAEGSRAH